VKSSLFRQSFAASVVCAALAVPSAQAVDISYELGGDRSETVELSNGLDATVEVAADTFSVDLTPSVAQQVFFQGGTVSLPAQANASGSGTLAPTLTITSPSATPASRTLSQSVSIFQSLGNPPFEPASADFILGGGSTVTYDLGGQYTLSVTPLGDSRTGQETLDFAFSYSASFLLTPVPEPAGLALLACGAGALLARRRQRL
jgi:hypothetical protein